MLVLSSWVCRLSSFSMTPEETPEMSFQADTRSLRQAITSFGCITAQVIHTQVTCGHRCYVECLMLTNYFLYFLFAACGGCVLSEPLSERTGAELSSCCHETGNSTPTCPQVFPQRAGREDDKCTFRCA